MLEVLDKPSTLKTEVGGEKKRLYIFGTSDDIAAVAGARAHDGHCLQSSSCPSPKRLRVIYRLSSQGEVTILQIFLKIDAEKWNCYYDVTKDDAKKVGKQTHETSHQVSYYLEECDTDKIRRLIFANEQRRARRKLLKKGPDVFLKTHRNEGG